MHIYIDEKHITKHYYEILKNAFPNDHFTSSINEKVTIWITMPGLVEKDTLERMPNLKWIQLLTAGYNQIDLNMLKERNITLTNARDVYAITIAEDIITKILVLNRNVKTYIKQMTNGHWQRHHLEPEIYGSTIGFLGSGSLATHAATRLKCFGAKVISFRQSDNHNDVFDHTHRGLDGLEKLIKESDILINTLPLNDNTFHLINKERLSWMKKEAIFINVGRGEVVDQDALIEALQNKQIRGAALDVTTPEPLPKDSPLWHMDQVYITPHNAPSSPKMLDRLNDLLKENLNRYKHNERLINII